MINFFKLSAVVCLTLLYVRVYAAGEPGGGEFVIAKTECISDDQRREIQLNIDRNTAELKRRGIIHDSPGSVVAFDWPLQAADNLTDFDYYGISNFVDHNNTTTLLDYNCGTRTYNGHKGTDIFTWPFGWYKMDNNQVKVIAAAPGVIIYRQDGQFDRSCAMNNNLWNAIYVRHADGSVAWYGHLKKNSLTTKVVGDNIEAGEYIGILGSSGNSTGPHLHFEVYNSSNALVDPWQGTCNSLNTVTWWETQKPYNDPNINALITHKKPPVFPDCPAQETINAQNGFVHGDTVYFAAYFRDQSAGATTQYSIIRPDNSVFTTWSHSSPNTYNASYWYWNDVIPANAPYGTWKFRAVFNSEIYEKTFTVGVTAITPTSENIPETYSLQQNYPNPFNPTTNINFNISKSGFTTLKIYDISGRESAVLVNENLAPGTYSINWNAAGLTSGVYFYRLESEGFSDTKRMILLK